MINKRGNIRDMCQNLLNGKKNQQRELQNETSILLIDEVDVFFSSDFYGQTYNPITLFKNDKITDIMNKIWQNKESQPEEIMKLIFNDQQYQLLIQKLPKLEAFLKSQIKKMCRAAKQVQLGQHNEYIVQDQKIGYKVLDQIEFNLFYGYLTTFAYFKEYDNGQILQNLLNEIIGINIYCGYYSYSEAPRNYDIILGVTGTLPQHNEIKQIIKQYNITNMYQIPSMFGENKLKFNFENQVFVEFDEERYYEKLKTQIQDSMKYNRPTLVFFQDNNSLQQYYKSNHLPCDKKDIIVINSQSKHLDNLVRQATSKKQITFLDRVFGRGTDFICNDNDIDKNEGIVVIQTFLSIDKCEEIQIKGRTARQSKKGEYVQILLAQQICEQLDIKLDDLKIKKREEWYYFIDIKRQEMFGLQIQKLNESIQKSQQKHKETIKLQDYLINNNKDSALEILKKFNQGMQQQSVKKFYHFIFCLDASGSMTKQDIVGQKSRWQLLIEAVTSFLDQRDYTTEDESKDKVSIIYYSLDAQIVCQFENIYKVQSQISKSKPQFQGTLFSQGLKKLQDILSDQRNKQNNLKSIVLFLSDGQDFNEDFPEVEKQLKNINIKFQKDIASWWNMGFGPDASQNNLQQMTTLLNDCNAQYKKALNAKEIQEEFSKLDELAGILK